MSSKEISLSLIKKEIDKESKNLTVVELITEDVQKSRFSLQKTKKDIKIFIAKIPVLGDWTRTVYKKLRKR